MKVCAYVDWMGTSQQTPEEEYEDIVGRLCRILEIDRSSVSFITDVYPHQLENQVLDLYVIDFGGVLPGCEDTIASHFRVLLTQIEDHPNTLFVLWSRWTQYWYEYAIQAFAQEFSAPNVAVWTGYDLPSDSHFSDQEMAIRSWFKLQDSQPASSLEETCPNAN